MNIMIGKYGKSCLFNEKSWGIIGGDEAPSTFFIKLAQAYPQHKFYMVGRSDLKQFRKVQRSKLSAFIKKDEECGVNRLKIPDNIIDVWQFKPDNVEFYKSGEKEAFKTKKMPHEWIAEWFGENNIKLDAGIIFSGPLGSSTLPNKIVGFRNPNAFCSPIEMLVTYGAPIVHTLNVTDVPHILLCEDPRYIPLSNRDTFNVEKGVLSQCNEIVDTWRIKNYEDQVRIEHKVPYKYSRIETIFLMREKKVDFRNIEKKNKMLMTINGGGKIRSTMIKEWILDKVPDCKIYGSWDDEWYEKYPKNFFKVAIRDMEPIMWDTKYTLIAPMMNTKFVTQKFWKMIYYGIIPFFHAQYDTDKILPVPNFLRCKSPDDLYKKIERLENNPDEYKLLLNELYNILDDGYFNGKMVLDEVNKGLKEFIGFDLNKEETK